MAIPALPGKVDLPNAPGTGESRDDPVSTNFDPSARY